MADGQISTITLPNGDSYEFKDPNVGITSTYDSTTHTVTLTVGSLTDADNMEY